MRPINEFLSTANQTPTPKINVPQNWKGHSILQNIYYFSNKLLTKNIKLNRHSTYLAKQAPQSYTIFIVSIYLNGGYLKCRKKFELIPSQCTTTTKKNVVVFMDYVELLIYNHLLHIDYTYILFCNLNSSYYYYRYFNYLLLFIINAEFTNDYTRRYNDIIFIVKNSIIDCLISINSV